MATRSWRETVPFRHLFRIGGIEWLLPAGAREVVTDERTIKPLSFQAWRRVATMITVPAEGMHVSIELLSIGSIDLADAQRIDASAAQ